MANYPLTLTIKALDKATGPLRAMTAKMKGITAPFRRFGKDFGEFSKAAGFAKIGAGISGVGRETLALGAKLFALAGVAGFAMFSIVKGAVKAGDDLATMSQQVGLSVDAYASLQHAAAQADVEQEAFNGAMGQFNKRLGEMKAGTGPLVDFLRRVSPALAAQLKGAKSTEGALSLMTDAMHRIKDPAKRAALAAAAFGRSGLQMGVFLGQGSDAIQEQQNAYMRLVGSQEDFARNSGELDNVMRETETAFLGLRAAALTGLFPAFSKLSKALTEFLVKNRDGIAKWANETGAAITKWVESGGIERLIESLREFANGIAWVFEKIGGLKGALIGLGLVMAGPLLASIVSLTVAVAPLVLAFWPFLAVAAAVAALGVVIWQNWQPLSALYDSIAGAVGGLLDVLIGIATWDFDKIVNGWTTAVERFRAAIMPALALLSQVAGGNMAINFLAGSGLLKAAGVPLGAASARVDPAGVSSSREPARIQVDFANLPKGSTVSVEPNSSQPIDVGRSMAW